MRRATYVILALLILLVGGTLLLLAHPILVTGRSYEFTVRKVRHTPEGIVILTYDDTLTYDSAVLLNTAAPRGRTMVLQQWDGKPPSFLHWPRSERDRTLALYLDIPEEPATRPGWLLKEGTYRIRPGDRLVLGRGQAPDGGMVEMTLEVTSGR